MRLGPASPETITRIISLVREGLKFDEETFEAYKASVLTDHEVNSLFQLYAHMTSSENARVARTAGTFCSLSRMWKLGFDAGKSLEKR
jgi:hypothetical protein